MTDIITQNVGVDICKATLDVYLHPAGSARQFANDAKGIIKRCSAGLANTPSPASSLNQPGRTITASSDG
jgi:hypothetical protein